MVDDYLDNKGMYMPKSQVWSLADILGSEKTSYKKVGQVWSLDCRFNITWHKLKKDPSLTKYTKTLEYFFSLQIAANSIWNSVTPLDWVEVTSLSLKSQQTQVFLHFYHFNCKIWHACTKKYCDMKACSIGAGMVNCLNLYAWWVSWIWSIVCGISQ